MRRHQPPHEKNKQRPRYGLIPLVLMCIGAWTVFMALATHVIVPVLVYLGGK